jgi:integrase
MCALLFGRHVTWPNGPTAPALIQVPAAEMKTEVDYAGELPLDLSRRLHHYRTRLAPEITGRVPSHLFVKSDGTPKRQESVTNRLVHVLNKRLGLNMSMHQFRHLAAKLMLDAHPGAHETVAQNLGHSGTRNVVRFYGGTDTQRATRHHAKLIEKLREDARQRGATRRRKT